jgi:hypothetical protein
MAAPHRPFPKLDPTHKKTDQSAAAETSTKPNPDYRAAACSRCLGWISIYTLISDTTGVGHLSFWRLSVSFTL